MQPSRHWRELQAAVAAGDLELDAAVSELVTAFETFTARYFRTKGKPYIYGDAHQRWLRAMCRTLVLGDYQLVLTPPRHGKTELLIRFCTWLIVAADPTSHPVDRGVLDIANGR